MPYDPRLKSQGGNRGIDEDFSRLAPKGKFLVVGVDTFDGTDWKEGDFDNLQLALKHIEDATKGQKMLKMYIYDERGMYVQDAGVF